MIALRVRGKLMKCVEVDKEELNLNNETTLVTYSCSRMYTFQTEWSWKWRIISLITRITDYERLEEDLVSEIMRWNTEFCLPYSCSLIIQRQQQRAVQT
jgi:hypothetical protein